MEKIDTDYKRRNLKSLAKLFKPFNRDWAPLKTNFVFGQLDLARLATETTWLIFLTHFLKEKWLFLSGSCFSYLFNTWMGLSDTLSSTRWSKISTKFSKLSEILKHRCDYDVNRALIDHRREPNQTKILKDRFWASFYIFLSFYILFFIFLTFS